MNNAITFTKGAQIRSINANDRVCTIIQPFIQEIFNKFLEVNGFAQAITQAAEKHKKVAEKLFDIDPDNVAESFSLKNRLIFPETNPLLFLGYTNTEFHTIFGKNGTEVIEDDSILPDIHNLLYLCGKSNLTYKQICQQISEPMVRLLDNFIRCSIVKEQAHSTKLVSSKTPGVFRLQHAALLFRTETTGVLVDPNLHSNYGIPELKTDISRAMLEGSVDAILISHSHYDHWNYSSLMMFPASIPIIVPKVPRGTIMCEDMEARLKSLGFQNVIAVDWYAEPITIGDIEINVLPFYGEQPLVPEYNKPIHPDLRNWGNTYLLRTEYYTSWFLIDAGCDPMGSMFEVAEYVKDKFGTIDNILSNFEPLSYNSIGTDLSQWGIDILANLLSNPRILSVTNKKEGEYIATLGPKGVATICNITKPKYCLPYAHSWAEIGEAAKHDEQLIQEVEKHLNNFGCSTKVIPWTIGESHLVQNSTTYKELIFN